MWPVAIIASFLLLNCVNANNSVSDYAAKCEFETENQRNSLDCSAALFSKFSFNIYGSLVVLPNDLCDSSVKLSQFSNSIVAVKRGQCSFDQKAINANLFNFRALIVLNSDDSFPMGASKSDYISKIPVLMIKTNELLESSNGKIRLAYEDKQSSIVSINRVRVEIKESGTFLLNSLAIGVAVLFLGASVVAIHSAVHGWLNVKTQDRVDAQIQYAVSSNGQYDHALQLVCVVILCCFFLMTRLSTFRMLPALNNAISSSDSSSVEVINSQFNHKETDEMIFQKLMEYVSRDIFDYTLKDKDIIRQFNLAPENYSDAVFIHPPLFVYLSAFLVYVCKLTLPALPILYQLVTLILIPAITAYVDPTVSTFRSTCYLVNRTSLTAMIVLVCCPLCWFCSQKFWIDNCLVMCVTICVAGHLRLLDTRKMMISLSKKGDDVVPPDQTLQCFLSGALMFGGVAMYCKITAFGLFPFLVGWVVLQRRNVLSAGYEATGKEILTYEFLRDSWKHTGYFLLGTALSYAPWAVLYHHYTGRWTPNAWPSETMLRNSSFVRAAVKKPFYYYVQVLLSISPCHAVGVLFGTVLAVMLLRRLWLKVDCRWCDWSTSITGYYTLVVFSLWPASFLAGLTLLGVRGAGYQSRFLLPLLPASAILCAMAVNMFSIPSLARSFGRHGGEALLYLVLLLCLVWSVAHGVYYGVLYAPLFAELDYSLLDILRGVLHSPYAPPSTRESYEDTLKFMAHFGLNRR